MKPLITNARGRTGSSWAAARTPRALSMLLGPLLAATGLGVIDDAQAVGETTRVSVDSHGNQAVGAGSNARPFSFTPEISDDGRFVAFLAIDSSLVSGDTNEEPDVFLHDRETRQTTRVSVDSAGNQGNSFSQLGAVSADGGFIVFRSSADNLVIGDTNGVDDVFVHERRTHQTTRVSVDAAGNQGDGASVGGVISADGRFVAFASVAGNLVPGDTNGVMDVFLHDRRSHHLTRVSVDAEGNQTDGPSYLPTLSANGRVVAFVSQATNLVSGDTNRRPDVFVHDLRTRRTTRVSVNSAGHQGFGDSWDVDLSADGRFVAFSSIATNFVPNDTNKCGDVFVHDLQAHVTTRVSVDSTGNQGSETSGDPVISADGRYVAFGSYASNLVPGDTNNVPDVFVHDRQTQQTTRVSVSTAGSQGIDFGAGSPAITADGRLVAFSSSSSTLVRSDTNEGEDIFLRDRLLDRSATADLAVTQTVSPSPFPSSSPITYTLNVANNGPDAAGEVTLVDGPLRGTAAPSQGHCSSGAPMVCYLGSLAAGARATVTLTLPPRSIGTPRVYNAARVNAAPVDPNPANNKTGLHVSVAP